MVKSIVPMLKSDINLSSIDDKIKVIEEYQYNIINSLGILMESFISTETDGSGNEITKLSLTVQEITSLIKSMASISKSISYGLYKSKEFELKEEIDFNHPKIERAFYFLFEAFLDSMKESGIDDESIDTVVNNLSSTLVGFEEKLNVSLKKISMTMVDNVSNPLINKIFDRDSK